MSNKSANKKLGEKMRKLETEIENLQQGEKTSGSCRKGPPEILKATKDTMTVIDYKQNIVNINEHIKSRNELQQRNRELVERVKELNCLYGIANLVKKQGTTIEEILQGTANIIPPSWQYPEVTCARIAINDQEYKTKNFKETGWNQFSDIKVHNQKAGVVEVCYLKEKPEIDEGPFLKEERNLLNAIATQLGNIIERNIAEETLQNQTNALRERVKELNCLYGMSSLLEKQGVSIDNILQETVALIPSSWQYPEITCARIIMRDRVYQTADFRESIWKQTANINVNGEKAGFLEVYYLKEKPQSDEGPFLKEERSLLNIITERLGKIIERIETSAALLESEERYRILTEQVADGVALIQDGRFVFANKAFAVMFGYPDANPLIGKEAIDLVSEDFKKEFKKLHEEVQAETSKEGIFHGKCLSMDGREFWIEEHYNVITWQGKPAFLNTARDITESKLREIAMQGEAVKLRQENLQLKSNLKDRYRLGDIIGKSPVMLEVYENIISASYSDASVVVLGESGTGKELVARAIHNLGERHNKPFVAVNCGAIPETLFESEFYGYAKGAFTGANKDKLGFFDLAHEGTLFLDEVGELALNAQVKLLRALDGGEFMPVGGAKAHKTDVRIIGATNKNLKDLVKQGLMREDFFYRIHVVPIHVSPLRERREDIPLLVEHFLKSNCNGGKQTSIPTKIMEAFLNHRWPGNIRELQNVIHRFITLKKFDFKQELYIDSEEPNDFSGSGLKQNKQTLPDALKKLEEEMISEALHEAAWHKTRAASILGINRKTLFKKIKHYQLTPPLQIGALSPNCGVDGPNEITQFLQ